MRIFDKGKLCKGLTQEDFNFKGPENSGMGSVYIKNRIPIHVSWYSYGISFDKIKNFLKKKYNVNMTTIMGGNGHYAADLVEM